MGKLHRHKSRTKSRHKLHLHKFQNKDQPVVIEVGARGRVIGKGLKGAFWCARDVLYFDLGGSFANFVIYKNY